MNDIENITKKPQKQSSKKKPQPKNHIISVICFGLILVFVVSAVLLFQNIINKGAESLTDSYQAAYASEKEATYQKLYQKYYDSAEAEYHVQNRATIKIGNIAESEKLEVLEVNDVEYVVADNDNFTSWLEVPGKGVYVVDLKAAEFIVENERAYVLVRLPYPELTNISIDSQNVVPLLLKNSGFIVNGSYQKGEARARKQLEEAELLIRREFASNQYIFLNAQEAAISTIKCMIQQLNPGIDNLTIDVEFY